MSFPLLKNKAGRPLQPHRQPLAPQPGEGRAELQLVSRTCGSRLSAFSSPLPAGTEFNPPGSSLYTLGLLLMFLFISLPNKIAPPQFQEGLLPLPASLPPLPTKQPPVGLVNEQGHKEARPGTERSGVAPSTSPGFPNLSLCSLTLGEGFPCGPCSCPLESQGGVHQCSGPGPAFGAALYSGRGTQEAGRAG